MSNAIISIAGSCKDCDFCNDDDDFGVFDFDAKRCLLGFDNYEYDESYSEENGESCSGWCEKPSDCPKAGQYKLTFEEQTIKQGEA